MLQVIFFGCSLRLGSAPRTLECHNEKMAGPIDDCSDRQTKDGRMDYEH